ncbi:hypothetical protein [Streptomyces sp. NPDC017991]|uniref:hypothetical protein n=1 Tax=Streptomyces sp. NPDC017991 TaxID=3365026 RepID=UPI003791D0B0
MKAAVVRAFGAPVVHETRPLANVTESIDGSVVGSSDDVPRGEIKARIVLDMVAGG